MPKIDFQISCTAAKYWVTVDDQDAADTTPAGSVTVAAGPHLLVWAMIGAAGDTMSLTGANGATTVVTVPSTAIPAGRTRTADYQHFTV